VLAHSALLPGPRLPVNRAHSRPGRPFGFYTVEATSEGVGAHRRAQGRCSIVTGVAYIEERSSIVASSSTVGTRRARAVRFAQPSSNRQPGRGQPVEEHTVEPDVLGGVGVVAGVGVVGVRSTPTESIPAVRGLNAP